MNEVWINKETRMSLVKRTSKLGQDDQEKYNRSTGTDVALRGRAYFVKHPSRIENLYRLHLLDKQKPYLVVNQVELTELDYENFITDLTVEREFLEESARLCSAQPDGAFPCVLARQPGRNDGVLAMPDELGFVIWAAYMSDVRKTMPENDTLKENDVI